MNDAVIGANIADAATVLHGVLGGVVAAHILTHKDPTWVEFGMHAFASSLDYVDGSLKDRAVRLASSVILTENRSLKDKSNHPTSEEWQLLESYSIYDRPQLDERIDKAYFYVVMAALVKRAMTNGDKLTAGTLAANLSVTLGRDGLKTYARHEASKYKLSTHATQRGKNKTKWQGFGLGVLTSPIARNAVGRFIGTAMITYSTGLGIDDLIHYRRDVKHGKARLGAN